MKQKQNVMRIKNAFRLLVLLERNDLLKQNRTEQNEMKMAKFSKNYDQHTHKKEPHIETYNGYV